MRRQEQKENSGPLPVSVIIPVLNGAATLARTCEALGPVAEIVVSDGGSTDGTPGFAAQLGCRVVDAPCGRGPQLAAGVWAARHAWLLLLHADTILQHGWQHTAAAHMRCHPDQAGYFRFTLDSDDRRARRLEHAVAWRCRVLSLPYGDQGLLIHRRLLQQAGGIRPIPLMEDVDLVRRLGRRHLLPLDAAALTSAAKWQRDGWLRRSARNLLCLGLWFAGLPPHRLVRLYR